MTRYTFDEIAIKAKKLFTCRCGRKRTKTMKFFQTLNPFNKNADGSVMTEAGIMKEIQTERAEWLNRGYKKEPCPHRDAVSVTGIR